MDANVNKIRLMTYLQINIELLRELVDRSRELSMVQKTRHLSVLSIVSSVNKNSN